MPAELPDVNCFIHNIDSSVWHFMITNTLTEHCTVVVLKRNLNIPPKNTQPPRNKGFFENRLSKGLNNEKVLISKGLLIIFHMKLLKIRYILKVTFIVFWTFFGLEAKDKPLIAILVIFTKIFS